MKKLTIVTCLLLASLSAKASEMSDVDMQYENLKYGFSLSEREGRILNKKIEIAQNQCRMFGTIYKVQLLKDFEVHYDEVKVLVKEGKKEEAEAYIREHLCEDI